MQGILIFRSVLSILIRTLRKYWAVGGHAHYSADCHSSVLIVAGLSFSITDVSRCQLREVVDHLNIR